MFAQGRSQDCWGEMEGISDKKKEEEERKKYCSFQQPWAAGSALPIWSAWTLGALHLIDNRPKSP